MLAALAQRKGQSGTYLLPLANIQIGNKFIDAIFTVIAHTFMRPCYP
jgi:hypothetical protein